MNPGSPPTSSAASKKRGTPSTPPAPAPRLLRGHLRGASPPRLRPLLSGGPIARIAGNGARVGDRLRDRTRTRGHPPGERRGQRRNKLPRSLPQGLEAGSSASAGWGGYSAKKPASPGGPCRHEAGGGG